MDIGMLDVDGHNFPNLPLMKISAWHKSQGDNVEFFNALTEYDRVYVSKVFDYTDDYIYPIRAKEIITGGTGYNIKGMLDDSIEHICPDYDLYKIDNVAYGFLTRGCPRKCKFCIVGEKEGFKSCKVADLSEFWSGQQAIKLLDPNLLACPDKYDLLQQLIDSRVWIDFTQGLDIRLMTDKATEMIMKCKIKIIRFAWDKQEDSDIIIKKLEEFKKQTNLHYRKLKVYMITNFDTEFEFDLHRVYTLKAMGYDPFIMVYDRQQADRKYYLLQRWVNNKIIFRSGSAERFEDYKPSKG